MSITHTINIFYVTYWINDYFFSGVCGSFNKIPLFQVHDNHSIVISSRKIIDFILTLNISAEKVSLLNVCTWKEICDLLSGCMPIIMCCDVSG